ncbi:MAG: Tm-1-like ATP-binding domain-containing protein [Candidatus Hydrogenedentes bacterium]|nr:Tm-1-like ATP-binding domain-containing protein [Candidatus Hydrogenedentota bacterium]
MSKTILIIGAFDTKGEEFAFLRQRVLGRGFPVLTMNVGVLGTTDKFPVDIEAGLVAQAGGSDIDTLRKKNDRGEAMKVMAAGAPVILRQYFDAKKFDGVIGMGGTGGTSVITAAMRALPIGVPKVCISTAAGADVSAYVGTSDIVLFPSIVDVAGLNRISRVIISRAAGAICGMTEVWPPPAKDSKPIIAASMFGNTTECVNACSAALSEKGYEVLVFHAIGTGGRTMESLVRDGLVEAVLDITTTEWADELCGGVFSAGPDRLSAPGEVGIPHLIVPGCVDMVNFGPMGTVPQKYRDDHRRFYEWNPSVTLMRTNAEENAAIGRVFAEKANAAKGPVAFLLPLRGVSILDGDNQPFCDRAADAACFDAIRKNVRSEIPVIEIDANINDAAFSNKSVELLLQLIGQKP